MRMPHEHRHGSAAKCDLGGACPRPLRQRRERLIVRFREGYVNRPVLTRHAPFPGLLQHSTENSSPASDVARPHLSVLPLAPVVHPRHHDAPRRHLQPVPNPREPLRPTAPVEDDVARVGSAGSSPDPASPGGTMIMAPLPPAGRRRHSSSGMHAACGRCIPHTRGTSARRCTASKRSPVSVPGTVVVLRESMPLSRGRRLFVRQLAGRLPRNLPYFDGVGPSPVYIALCDAWSEGKLDLRPLDD